MNKPHNKTTIIKPSPSDIPWTGMMNFHIDLTSQIEGKASLEALSAAGKPPTSGDCVGGESVRTTSIFKKNDAYYVYFHTSELDSNWGANLNSFSRWLMSLSDKETVYIHQTGDVWYLTGLIQIIGTLGTDCKARKVFVVDHPIENALFLLSCDDVIITELGALTFSNAMDIDPSKWDLIYMPYLKSLYARAVERNYITEADVTAILEDNAIIFKTAKQLRESGVTVI